MTITTDDTIAEPSVELAIWRLAGAQGQGSACPLCGDHVSCPVAFQVADANGVPVCENCVEKHLTPGHWDLLEGIDSIDTALDRAAPEHRPGVLATAMQMLGQLAEYYRAIAEMDGDETPGSKA